MNALLVFIFALMPYCLLATDDYQYDAPPHGGRRPVDVEIGEDYYEDNKPYYYPGEYEKTPGYNQGNYGYGKQGIDCGPLPEIKNGKVEIVPDTKKASIAMYICDEGFLLYGKGQRVCTYGGWSGKPAKCIPVDCGYLPNIENGRLILSGTEFRDTATYLCKFGFDLIGDRQRKCQGDGEWSTSAPKCEKISCPKLSPPSNGKIFTTGEYPSDIAIYSCAYGFYLDGQKRRECERTGEWSGTDPECKKIEPINNIGKKGPGYGHNEYIPKDDYAHDDYYGDDYTPKDRSYSGY